MTTTEITALLIANLSLLGIMAAAIVYMATLLSKKDSTAKSSLLLKKRELELGELEIFINEIAKKLHDDVIQAASLCNMQVHHLKRDLKDEGVLSKVQQIREGLSKIITTSTRTVLSLNKNYTHSTSLYALIAAELKAHHLNIASGITANRELIDIEPYTKMVIFRIAQEAICNSLKHARPNMITVNLILLKDSFSMTIQDDGSGIMPEKIHAIRGNGIPNMQHRAKSLNAKLDIQTGEMGIGCRVVLTIDKPNRLLIR